MIKSAQELHLQEIRSANTCKVWQISDFRHHHHAACTNVKTSSLLKNQVVKRTTHRSLDFPLKRDNRTGWGGGGDFFFSHHCTPKFPSLGFCVWKACIVSQDTNKSVFFPFHLCRKIIKKGGALDRVQADFSVQKATFIWEKPLFSLNNMFCTV